MIFNRFYYFDKINYYFYEIIFKINFLFNNLFNGIALIYTDINFCYSYICLNLIKRKNFIIYYIII